MSKGIDYSEWDHFGSDSDEEEEFPAPRVTRLDAPSQISTAPDGTIHVKTDSGRDSKKSKPERKSAKSMDDYVQEWTTKGGAITMKDAASTTLYWSQDRESVTVRLQVPLANKGSDVQVTLEGAVSVEDRHCATMTPPRPTLSVALHDTTVLEGELPYPVYLEDATMMDWTLETVSEHKYLVICLQKAIPMPGMTLWWTRPLTQFDEIQLSSSGGSFQQAWNEAHAQFQQKMKQTKNDRMSLKHDDFSIEEVDE